MSELKDLDWARIADLAGNVRAAEAEVVTIADETRLKFNSPTRVRYVVIRAGRRQLELFHWVEEDEWELVHESSLP